MEISRNSFAVVTFLGMVAVMLAVGCSDDDNPSSSPAVQYAWEPLGTGLNGGVEQILVFDHELIAIGEFSTAGGASASHVAAWDGSSWSPLGSGINGAFNLALAVYDDKLCVGGDFTTAGGLSANRIATWDGTAWAPLGSPGSARRIPWMSS